MKAFVTLLLNVFRGYERKHLQIIAAGLAYYFAMSLFPALILLTALTAYLPVRNGAERAASFAAHVVAVPGLVSGGADHRFHQVTSNRTPVAGHFDHIVAYVGGGESNHPGPRYCLRGRQATFAVDAVLAVAISHIPKERS